MASTTAKSKFYIGTTAAAANLAAYEADTFVEVKDVEDLGEFGDSAEEITVTTIGDARRRKLKGPRDAGTHDIVVIYDPSDAGAQAMNAAVAADDAYNIKVEMNDKPDATGTPTTFYFRARVMSYKHSFGSGSDVVKRTYSLSIDSEILEVEAEAGV
ncbi:hypothetical protein [Propylenella binzhouense]|uniref:Phage tail protein n=1 Tax=Propylenella binzhouense TaxID=2555902 RepID=A0A964T128_9HYPH|nr:hypothetical protein [Propylenella binzhouense]MYZ46466.1 hypothetical protein [Propylenella binzhouense]